MSWIDELKVGDNVIVCADRGWNRYNTMYVTKVSKISAVRHDITVENGLRFNNWGTQIANTYHRAWLQEFTPANEKTIEYLRKFDSVTSWLKALDLRLEDTALIDALYKVMEGEKSK